MSGSREPLMVKVWSDSQGDEEKIKWNNSEFAAH